MSRRRRGVAQPHGFLPDGFERSPLRKADSNMHAAGGHFATARDLARFVAVHLSGRAEGGRGTVPSLSALQAMQQQHVEQDRQFLSLHRFGWGYGWDLGTYEGDTVVHRFGGFPGYHSHLSFMPQHGIGVVVLVNSGGPSALAADLLATYVYDRLLGKAGLEDTYAARIDSMHERLEEARRGLAAHLAERKARLGPVSHPLEHYAGVYESPRYGRMEWRLVANGLEVRMGVARSRAEVFDASEDMLRVELAGGNVLDFESLDHGHSHVAAHRSHPGRSATRTGPVYDRAVTEPHRWPQRTGSSDGAAQPIEHDRGPISRDSPVPGREQRSGRRSTDTAPGALGGLPPSTAAANLLGAVGLHPSV